MSDSRMFERPPHIVIDIPSLEQSMGYSKSAFPVSPPPLSPLPSASANIRLHKALGVKLEAGLVMAEAKSLMRVDAADSNSIAEYAGVRDGDIVLAANGEALECTGDVLDVIGAASGIICMQGLRGSTVVINKPDVSTPIGLTVSPMAPVVVTNIMPTGLAAMAGLRPGDQLLSVNGRFCNDAHEAAAIIAACSGEMDLEIRLPRPQPTRVSSQLRVAGGGRRTTAGPASPLGFPTGFQGYSPAYPR